MVLGKSSPTAWERALEDQLLLFHTLFHKVAGVDGTQHRFYWAGRCYIAQVAKWIEKQRTLKAAISPVRKTDPFCIARFGKEAVFPHTLMDMGIELLRWESGYLSRLHLVISTIWSHRCVQSRDAIATTTQFSLLCIKDSRWILCTLFYKWKK